MKQPISIAFAIASTLTLSPAIAQTEPDITGRWFLENISEDRDFKEIIEFRYNGNTLQVVQSESTASRVVYNDVLRSGNQIEFPWDCRGSCYMEGEIADDGMSGTLQWTVRDRQGNILPDSPQFTYELTKITSEYCPVTGQWQYRSQEDFVFSPNSGFSDGGPPYRATVNLEEDEDGNVTMSGFYNMSAGEGTGDRQVNNILVEMPLTVGEATIHSNLSHDNQKITGMVHLSEDRYDSSAGIRFEMTRQTECGENPNRSNSPEDVIIDVIEDIF